MPARTASGSRSQAWIKDVKEFGQYLGLALTKLAPGSIARFEGERALADYPRFRVVSARPARRVFPSHRIERDLVVQIAQGRYGCFDRNVQKRVDSGEIRWDENEPDFVFPGGCTLVIDMKRCKVRYIVAKNICDESRLNRVREFLNPSGTSHPLPHTVYPLVESLIEPFEYLHRGFTAFPRRLIVPFTRSGDLNVFFIENGIGRPIVFVHGNWATSSWWERVMAKLPEDLRGIAYDMRGRGQTVGPDSDYSIPSLAADLKAFADELGLDRMHVVGHSLGSAIAIQFALEHPERVRTLTVVAPIWVDGRPSEPTDEEHQREFINDRELFDKTMKSLCPTVPDDDYWRRLLDEGHEQRLGAALGVFPACANWMPGDRLQSIPCPKLVIGGDLDPLIGPNVVERAAKALGGCRVVMRGVGHGPNIEAPDAFLMHLLSNIKS